MKTFQKQSMIVSIALAGAILLAAPGGALGEASSREKAQQILEEVKQRKLESQVTAKQTELQRLEEDHNKRQEEAENLQRSIDTISSAIGEASGSLERLSSDRRRLVDLLELTNQRIEAERLKVEGLKVLSDAQIKARDLVLNQSEETSLRSGIAKGELKLLADKQIPSQDGEMPKEDAGKLSAELSELKKKLTRSEKLTLAASKTARDTMATANEKLLQADKADAKSKKTAAGLGHEEKASAEAETVLLDPIAEPPPAAAPKR